MPSAAPRGQAGDLTTAALQSIPRVGGTRGPCASTVEKPIKIVDAFMLTDRLAARRLLHVSAVIQRH